MQDAGGVDTDEVARAVLTDTCVVEQFSHGDPRRTGTDDHDGQFLDTFADDPGGIDQRGQSDDRRAVLIVVEDRDVNSDLEPLFDLEALGST